MALRVLFRVDAGPAVGIGHLQRCISLALALGELGAESAFLALDDGAVRDRLGGFGIEHIVAEGSATGDQYDLGTTVSLATSRGFDAVIVDVFRPNSGFLRGLQDEVPLVAAVDDMAPFPFPCRAVINGNGDAPTLDYRSAISETRFLLGTRYALLRPEFFDLPDKVVRGEVNHVVVTTGGGDQHGLLPRLVRWLDEIPGDFAVTAVVGPVSGFADEAQQAAASSRRSVSLVHSPASLRDLMLAADIAISAGGQTLYELAATGTPTLAIQVADNQAGNIQALSEKGAIRRLGRAGESGLTENLRSMMAGFVSTGGHAARLRMSSAGRALVDGRGARRAARELMAIGGVE